MANTSLKTGWIISKKDDLLWLIYPALVGFLIIGLYYLFTRYVGWGEETTVIVIYLSWAMLFDGTHAFATYSRTYFDKEFYQQNKKMLLRSLLVFVIGPIFILTVFSITKADLTQTSAAFIVFNRFAICYAYYHLIRQHWGFVVIYRKKNNEPDDITRRLDGLLLAFGTLFPFVHGQINQIKIIHIAETMPFTSQEWLTLAGWLAVIGAGALLLSFIKVLKLRQLAVHIMGSIALISAGVIYCIQQFTLTGVLLFASYVMALGFCITVVWYGFLLMKNRTSPLQNKPKWLLLATVIISYNIAFHLNIPILILIAAITVFHNIQYHKIVNFHNVNKYKAAEKERFGFAVTLAQRLGIFITLALLFNLFSYIPRVASNVMITNLLLNYLLSSFFWGVAFHHYYLDSVIWKFKGNQKLNTDLKLQ